MPDSEKRQWADFTIENNGTLVELETTTKLLINHIRAQEKFNA
jgi:dephospho-CoA kinase